MLNSILSGPMGEPAASDVWSSVHDKRGAHYNVFGLTGGDEVGGMEALRSFFKTAGSVNEMNLVLFSTSGAHGSYSTIEDAEREGGGVTFLMVQPRLVCLRYGVCYPKTPDDFQFLKDLRSASMRAVARIGH